MNDTSRRSPVLPSRPYSHSPAAQRHSECWTSRDISIYLMRIYNKSANYQNKVTQIHGSDSPLSFSTYYSFMNKTRKCSTMLKAKTDKSW